MNSFFLVFISVLGSYLTLSLSTAQVISKLLTELIYSPIELGPREKACKTITFL